MARCILLLTALAIAPVAVLHAADPSISFTLDKPGQVSLGVYKQGRLLRELLRGEPKEAGEHSVDWDGLDRYGNAMPPGDYEWRLLRNDGFRAEYLLSIGVNPRSAPYAPWVGNHQAATAVTVDPRGHVRRVCQSRERTGFVAADARWEQGLLAQHWFATLRAGQCAGVVGRSVAAILGLPEPACAGSRNGEAEGSPRPAPAGHAGEYALGRPFAVAHDWWTSEFGIMR